jgi:hypothetical protein
VIARIDPSTLISSIRGMLGGMRARSTRVAATATATLAAPPRRHIGTCSIANWRTRRPRLAPRLARIAISAWRRIARATKSPATFAQTMTKTSPEAPSSIQSRPERRPTST